MFLELGLPFILRFVNDWRAGKTTIKEAVKNVQHPLSEKGVATSSDEAEKKFMEKVERELALPSVCPPSLY
jgi:anoctamin-10